MPHLFYLEECLSTQDELNPILLLNPQNFCGVYTFNQTKGRGQYGNSWQTKPNENIAFSLAAKSSVFQLNDTFFNYYTAILVRDFLANLTALSTKIKWPNDIILEKKKVVGILIEKRKLKNETYFVIGIGLNVLQREFPEISNAGSLFTQTNHEFGLHDLAENLCDFLIKHMAVNISESEVLERFNAHLFRKNEISVFEIQERRQNGIVQNADGNGNLWIDLENDGLQKFYHKEIKLLY
jgi:BirA family biotin operon repressor/biotin-[acetyl-CoA-carboxylase] ligase